MLNVHNLLPNVQMCKCFFSANSQPSSVFAAKAPLMHGVRATLHTGARKLCAAHQGATRPLCIAGEWNLSLNRIVKVKSCELTKEGYGVFTREEEEVYIEEKMKVETNVHCPCGKRDSAGWSLLRLSRMWNVDKSRKIYNTRNISWSQPCRLSALISPWEMSFEGIYLIVIKLKESSSLLLLFNWTLLTTLILGL